MFRYTLVLGIILHLLLAAATANATNAYMVENLQVTAMGSDAKQARDIALRKGEKEAYHTVIKRITPEFVQHYQAQIASPVIASLVQSYDLQNEKVTPSHYEATVSITFSQPLMRRHLLELGVSYIDRNSAAVLVIPVLYDDNNIPVIDTENVWQKAWQQAEESVYLLQLAIPDWHKVEASITLEPEATKELAQETTEAEADLLSFPIENVDDAEQQALPARTIIDDYQNPEFQQKLLQLYQAKYLLIAEAKSISNDAGVHTTLFTSSSLTEPKKEQDAYSFTQGFSSKPAADTQENVFEEAVRQIAQKIENEWKLQQSYEKFSTTNLRVTIPIKNGLKEWQAHYKALKSFDFIDKIVIESLSVNQADLLLTFTLSYRELSERLMVEDWHLQKTDAHTMLYYEKKQTEKALTLPGFLRGFYKDKTKNEAVKADGSNAAPTPQQGE